MYLGDELMSYKDIWYRCNLLKNHHEIVVISLISPLPSEHNTHGFK